MRIITIILIILYSFGGYTQDTHSEDLHQHENRHHHKKNEVSIALGVVPLPSEDKVTAGIHLHNVKGLVIQADLKLIFKNYYE